MRGKIYYKNLFQKMNKNSEKTFFNIYLESYLRFLELEDNIILLENITEVGDRLFKKKIEVLEYFELDREEKISLLSVLILKKLNKSIKVDSIYDINYLGSDQVLNDITELYKNIYIYYIQKLPQLSELHYFKGIIIKFIKILVQEEIVISKKILCKNKTYEKWSFGKENRILSDFEIIKISSNPYTLAIVENEYYLIGDFFTFVKKVFLENKKSNYFFKLNDVGYINAMLKNKVYLNLDDLKDVTNVFRAQGLSKEEIINKIQINNKKILVNLEQIKECKSEIKKIFIDKIKRTLTGEIDLAKADFEEVKHFCLELFYDYSTKFIKANYNLEIRNRSSFMEDMYEIFKKNFNNAFLKLEFENLKELTNHLEDFLEYNISVEELKSFDKGWGELKFKKIINKKKKIRIVKKINPNDISFFTYLLLYSKKELNKFLKDWKRSEKKIKTSGGNTLNYLIEKPEKSIKNHVSACLNIALKLNIKTKGGEYLMGKYQRIKKAENTNKLLFAEISKITHIMDIFTLEEYCRDGEIFKNLSDENLNIRIYMMFYFDFRGRLYFDSPISPTSNKFCRFIYNYGIYDLKDIDMEINRDGGICNIIEENKNYIEEVKEIFDIKTKNRIIGEWIFWILVSVGKLRVDKNLWEIPLTKFLEKGIEVIKDRNMEDSLDKIEVNYYIKILSSLNKKKIVRRCLVKDATASFFQNLMRILGAKNEVSKKIANLNSKSHWYDWYSFILSEWKKSENTEKELRFFTRKTIKKVCMTLPYSASFITCFEYFQEGVLENFNTHLKITEEDGKNFIRFYKFLNNMFESKGPFLKNTSEITKHFNDTLLKGEPVLIISRDEDMSNLTYYKTITKQFDFIIKWNNKKQRILKNYIELDKQKIDIKKTTSSLKANLVHFADALLIRDINKEIHNRFEVYYLSVHDSFLVDFTQVSDFIIISNKMSNRDVFKKEIWNSDKNYFSIFIFL